MKPAGDCHAIAREELRFFGEVSAAISHEINNRIAVIYEKAGLLEDLAESLVRGRDVEPGRFAVQSRKIVEQVRLAKEVVSNLNRFSHSVDVACATVDLDEVLEFVASLYARKAARAEVTVSVSPSSMPVTIRTCPFALEVLVGRAIDVALARMSEGGVVIIRAEATTDGITVRFGGLGGVDGPIDLSESVNGVPALLEWIGARFKSSPDGTEVILEIPDHEVLFQGRTT